MDCPDNQSDLPSHTARTHASYFLANLEIPRNGYEIVGGIHLGALVSVEVVKQLEKPPKRVLLIDPPINLSLPPGLMEMTLKLLQQQREDTDEVGLRAAMDKRGLGTREDWTAKRLAILRNSPQSVKQSVLVGKGGFFAELMLMGRLKDNTLATHSILPSAMGQSQYVLVAGDSSSGATFYNVGKHSDLLAKSYSHVRLVRVTGKANDLLLEAPETVAEVALSEDFKDVSEVAVLQ